MKKKIIVIIIMLFLILTFLGCMIKEKAEVDKLETQAITLEEIFSRYQDIQYTAHYYNQKNYVLIEYQEGLGDQIETLYDLYNCQTGDVDRIRPHGASELVNFTDKKIELLYFGHIEEIYFKIPSYIVYGRNAENSSSEDDFLLIRENPKQFTFDEKVVIKGKPGALTDICCTFTGIQLLFSAIPNQETDFLVAYATSPNASVYSGTENNQLVYEFEGKLQNDIEELNNCILDESHSYLKSVIIESQEDFNKIILNLKDKVTYSLSQKYTLDGLPFVEFTFYKFIKN